MENKICVYAITKNESKFVDRWYESMKEADCVVVLDTGSTDDTVQKLRDKGIRVEVKEITPWRFDVARNEALALAPEDCNILISTDLDEVLEPGWAKILRDEWIEGLHTRAKYKYVWSHLANGAEGRIFYYNKIHDRNWIWRYPVHELLWNINSQTEDYFSENSLDLGDRVVLHHYPDSTKSRKSYLPLLEMRERDYPDDHYGLIYLSHEYYYQGLYEKSIEKLNKVLTVYKNKNTEVEEASCYLFMGDSYFCLDNLDKAIEAYEKAINILPSYREPYLNLAKVYLKQEKYSKAIELVKKALSNTYRHYSWLERDTSWDYEPYDILCLAYYYSGDKLKSLACAYKASLCQPDDERLSNNVKCVLGNLTDLDF